MLIRFWFGLIHIGRPAGIGPSKYDASVTLALGRRDDVPSTELRWRYISRWSWNWLPDRIYAPIGAVAQQPTTHERLTAAISGKSGVSATLFSENLLPAEYALAIDSSRWTGRDKKLIGFGAWRRERVVHCATWRSLMHVYLTGSKERKNPSHVLYVAPAAMMKAEDAAAEWKDHDGKSLTLPIEFKFGRAEVPSNLGEWMIATGTAHRTNLVKATGKSMLGSLAATIAGR